MKQFRIDRLLTLYLFYYPMAVISRPSKWHIPILMYHSISEDNGSKRMHPYYQTNTSPAIFERHMQYLHKNKYNIVDLRQAVKLLKNGESIKVKYAVITFDDGFRDFYTDAFPIMKRYGYSATIFLPTAFIDKKRRKFKNRECLSWDEVSELKNNEIIFGSHTVNHQQLQFMSKKEIEHELRQSKETIEVNLGCPVESFSYPFAYPEDSEFKKYLRDCLEKCGYYNGVSTRIGTTNSNDDFYAMKRIPVNSCDDILLFKAKLEGSYDWLYSVQYLFKKFKRNNKT